MDISVIGAGYVGLTAGLGLAHKGHNVTCVDTDMDKLSKIRRGESPIYEKGVQELLDEMSSRSRFSVEESSRKAVENSEISIFAVGTPVDNGDLELDALRSAARDAAAGLGDEYHVFTVKSTVLPGTSKTIASLIEDESGQSLGEDFGICMNPEFLREGSAVDDFLEPDRIVIGEHDRRSGDRMEEVYSGFEAPVIRTSLETAELIKYASNSLLATKISFANEIGNLSKKLGIDAYEVVDSVGMDSRVERAFLDSGVGFGGSCFQKDLEALVSFMRQKDLDPRVIESVIDVNERQKTRIVDLLEERIDGVDGKTVAVLGLAFKPGTDDVRNSPAIEVIRELKEAGARVKAYDPEASSNMREYFPGIEYFETYVEAIEGADSALILTDWPEFDGITRGELKNMNEPVLLEGRKVDHDLDDTEGITWP